MAVRLSPLFLCFSVSVHGFMNAIKFPKCKITRMEWAKQIAGKRDESATFFPAICYDIPM